MRTSAFLKIPVFQNFFQATRSLGQHAVGINFNRDSLNASGLYRCQSVVVHVQIAEHTGTIGDGVSDGIPIIANQLHSLGKPVSRAACQDNFGPVSIGHRWVQQLLRKLTRQRKKRRVATGGAILEGSRQINALQRICLGCRLGNFHVR